MSAPVHKTPSDKHYKYLKNIAQLLDNKFEGPFGWRFGLDPIIGLIPVIGDLITVLASMYILFNAYLLGCSFPVFLRMLFNIALEYVVKIVPFIGVIFDFVWKANIKNIELLDAHLAHPQKARRQSALMIALVIFILFVFLLFCLGLAVVVFSVLVGLVSRLFLRISGH